MALLSSLTARESADYWKRFIGEGPSTGTLVRLSGRPDGVWMFDRSYGRAQKEELPEGATMVHVGLDGVMMRMNAEKNGDEVIEEAGWREASCGVVTVRERRKQITEPYIGQKKGKSQITNPQEVNHLRSQNPDLKLPQMVQRTIGRSPKASTPM